MGESLIAGGDIEQGVEHLANAIVVCGQPTQLLQVCDNVKNYDFLWWQHIFPQILQQTLPAQVFNLLIQKMRVYSTKEAEKHDSGDAIISDLNDELE